MVIFSAEVREFPKEKMNETSPEWPAAYIKINASPQRLIEIYGSNHAHAVEGDVNEELKHVCDMLDIDVISL